MSRVKLITIPFAGGNRYSYDKFRALLPAEIVLKPVEFPGRGDRLDEPCLTDAKGLALDVLSQIKADIQEGDYVIYGHSLGATVGYELAKEIQRRKYPLPSCLFFTGRSAPSVPDDHAIASLPGDKFWHEVKKFGGLPEEILASEELLEFFEPILRSDFQAAESYRYESPSELLAIPIHVIAGTEETDISQTDLDAWQNETVFPLHCEFMSGNHFFIFNHIQTILKCITLAYEAHIGNRSTRIQTF